MALLQAGSVVIGAFTVTGNFNDKDHSGQFTVVYEPDVVLVVSLVGQTDGTTIVGVVTTIGQQDGQDVVQFIAPVSGNTISGSARSSPDTVLARGSSSR